MGNLTYCQKELVEAFFNRTGEGVLPEHLIEYLQYISDYENIVADAQRYLSDLFFAKQNSHMGL